MVVRFIKLWDQQAEDERVEHQTSGSSRGVELPRESIVEGWNPTTSGMLYKRQSFILWISFKEDNQQQRKKYLERRLLPSH